MTSFPYVFRDALAEVGAVHHLVPTGFRWYEARQGQRLPGEVYGCAEFKTHDARFLGTRRAGFDMGRRMGLAGLPYQVLSLLPEKPSLGILDARVSFVAPEVQRTLAPLGHGTTKEVVAYEQAEFIPVQNALADGTVSPASMFAALCREYELPHILKHRRHYVSPDSASVKAFEAILSLGLGKSVLEVGSGVGVCGVAARRAGLDDFIFADISAPVCAYLRERFPEYQVVHADAFDIPTELFARQAVLVGIPYHLNPRFLAERGALLAASCEIAVFNTGARCFYQFEHDLLMGNDASIASWPWWRPEQTLTAHFPHAFEAAFDWQTVAVAGHDPSALSQLQEAMCKSGFTPISANRIAF